jgi:hypothetical protein
MSLLNFIAKPLHPQRLVKEMFIIQTFVVQSQCTNKNNFFYRSKSRQKDKLLASQRSKKFSKHFRFFSKPDKTIINYFFNPNFPDWLKHS